MARQKTKWRFVHVGSENDELELGGLPVWREGWRDSLEPVILSDPSHPSQTQRLGVYEIGPADSPVRFAAGEFSDGIWGFFIPAQDWRYRVVDVIPDEGLGTIIMLAGATDLPAAAQVAIRLKMPDGAVVELTGMKAWELPVDGPPYEQDAFLLSNIEGVIPKGALAEVAELGRAASDDVSATGEEPRSLSSGERAFGGDGLLLRSVEQDIPEGALTKTAEREPGIVLEASAAGEVRPPLSPRERALAAAIGNAGLTSVVIGTPETNHRSLETDLGAPETDREPRVLIPIGSRTIFALWFFYSISALYVIYLLKDVIYDLILVFKASNLDRLFGGKYENGLLIWLGASIFYLAIGPVAILKLDRLRQIRG